MKDSGVAWIGDIPSSWKVVYLSSLLSERKNKNIGMHERNLLSLSYGRIIRKDINTNDGLLPDSFEGYNIIEDGDIVLRLTDLQNDQRSLRTGLCHERGIITSAYCSLKQNTRLCDSRFLHYYLHCFDVCKGFYGMGAGVRQGLNYEGIRKIEVLLPSFSEQLQIADYLDASIAKTDALIANQQAQIEKLKQYKQSLITEVVTKGLDPNAPMKDSGVEWIGEMPKAWYKNKTIRIFGKIGSGTTPKGEEYYTDEGINWIQSGDINGGVIQNENKHVSPNALACFTALEVYKAPYLIMAMYGASVGNLSVSTIDACVNQACCVLRNPNIHFKYSYYALSAAKDYLIRQAVGGGQPNISQATIKSLWLPMPTLTEQKSIACYLDKACDTINTLVRKKQEKISILSRYKKSLIYEYVTGKKEVL